MHPQRRTPRNPGVTLPRRTFLAAGAAAIVASACGSGTDSGSQATADTTALPTGDPDTLNLGQLFSSEPTYARAEVEQRLTWGIFDFNGAPAAATPDELIFEYFFDGPPGATSPKAERVGDPMASPLRIEGLPRGYYSQRFTPDREGIWRARTEIGGQLLEASFQVGPAGGPGVIEIGTEVPAFATATNQDSLGVDPLCTRAPACSFHGRSFDEVLGAGSPVVLSISTPVYCQVAICGPVLDLLVDTAPDYPTVTIVHAEPYVAPEPGDPFAGGTIDALSELGLEFEPTLLLIDGDGTLVDRLDNIYDLAELRESLDKLA